MVDLKLLRNTKCERLNLNSSNGRPMEKKIQSFHSLTADRVCQKEGSLSLLIEDEFHVFQLA